MLIFDSFENKETAEKFAAHVELVFQRKAYVFMTKAASDESDIFPFELYPPIVHVERIEVGERLEKTIEESVLAFGGIFVGT
jgi:hypothetical protein